MILLVVQGAMSGWTFEQIVEKASNVFVNEHGKAYDQAIGKNVTDFMRFLFLNLTGGKSERDAVFALIKKRYIQHFVACLPEKDTAETIAAELSEGIIRDVIPIRLSF